MMIRSCRRALAAVLLLAASLAVPAAFAQAAGGDTVLVSNSLASVTRAEYDAELLRLPPDLRDGFANSPRRVADLLARMLLQKSLAVQAKAAQLDATPEAKVRIRLELDRILAQIMVDDVEAKAAAAFDKDKAKFEVRARELYLVDRAKFTTPEQVSATHILFDVKKHTSDEAKRLAQDARAKILAGADMSKLARDLSDDPSAGMNGGSLGWFSQKEMDPAFGAAAFALKSPGDVSEPVQSTFGWHVIRLDGRRPPSTPTFEQARETIMADLKKSYVDQQRDALIAAIRRDPKTATNREAVDALTPKVDVEQALRSLGTPPPGMPK